MRKTMKKCEGVVMSGRQIMDRMHTTPNATQDNLISVNYRTYNRRVSETDVTHSLLDSNVLMRNELNSLTTGVNYVDRVVVGGMYDRQMGGNRNGCTN